jgi:hypothetical protein
VIQAPNGQRIGSPNTDIDNTYMVEDHVNACLAPAGILDLPDARLILAIFVGRSKAMMLVFSSFARMFVDDNPSTNRGHSRDAPSV